MKAISPLVGTVLLIAFTIGVGGLTSIFFIDITQTSTEITENASGSLTSCSTAAIDVPRDSVYCVSGYNLTLLTHFDEGSGTTAGDSSGNNNAGNLLDTNTGNSDGNTPPTWVDGRFGKALNFDGVDDVVEITHSNTLAVGEVTMEAWFRPFTIDVQHAIINKDESKTLGGRGWIMWLEDDNRFYALCGYGSGTDDLETVSIYSKTIAEANRWYHIVGVCKNNDKVKLYVNGVLENETSFPFTLRTPTTPLWIGNGKWQGSWYIPTNGTIEEARVYNRALSSAEIKHHYESGIMELFGNKSVAKFQLQNNGQYNLGRNFNFALTTSSASNATNITLVSDLNIGNNQLVKLSNLTMTPSSVSSVQNLFITSVVCPNVQINVKDLSMDC